MEPYIPDFHQEFLLNRKLWEQDISRSLSYSSAAKSALSSYAWKLEVIVIQYTLILFSLQKKRKQIRLRAHNHVQRYHCCDE